MKYLGYFYGSNKSIFKECDIDINKKGVFFVISFFKKWFELKKAKKDNTTVKSIKTLWYFLGSCKDADTKTQKKH